MHSSFITPATNAASGIVDDMFVKTLRYGAVVSERLQLSRTMPAFPFWKQAVEIDCLLGSSMPVTDGPGDWSLEAFAPKMLDVLDECHYLHERDLTSSFWRHDGRHITFVNPATQRRLADSEQARRLRRADRRPREVFERFTNRRDVAAHSGIASAFGTPQANNAVDQHHDLFVHVRSLVQVKRLVQRS